MGNIPNLPLFAAQIWAKNDYAKELQWFSGHWLKECISSLAMVGRQKEDENKFTL